MKVIIVGGGITGASLALAISIISQRKIKISLVESNVLDNSHFSYNFDVRTIALAYGTCYQFKKIGIWHKLKKYVTPITHIHISEYGNNNAINIYAEDYSIPALGYSIELYDLINHLFNKLKKESNIELYCPNKVIDVKRTLDRVSVKLITGKVLNGQLLIAADGNNSMVGKLSQIEWQKYSYQQCAIITNVLTSELPCGKAFEYFTQNGTLAMLPISRGRSSLIWCHPLKNQNNIMQWTNEQFIVKLQNRFGWKLGKIKSISKRYYFSLLFSQAKRIITHRLVLIGSAAQTLHPIAGQSFNLTMRDVMILANLLSKAIDHIGDIGSYSVLEQYQMHRRNDRYYTIKLTDNLVRLFSNNNLVLSIIRNIGLISIGKLPFIRDILINQIIKQSFYF